MTEPEGKVRIVLADDHPIFRSGLRNLLETQSRYEVVGEACDGAGVAALVQSVRPDVLLLDYSMPGMSGLDAVRELHAAGAQVRTILLTAAIEQRVVVDLLRLGAAGVLYKSAATELLFKCIDAVVAGQYWVDRATTRNIVSALQHVSSTRHGHGLPELTPRERQILAALMKGESNKQIARDLGIAEQTVKNHLSQLYARFEVSSRLSLMVVARERSLL
jgi:DNA-binding NarL/FixJ family response regulator